MHRVRSHVVSLALLIGSVAFRASPAGAIETKVVCTPGKGSYAVVVSRKTHDDKAWHAVVEALREKHQASVIVYPKAVGEAWAELAKLFPRFACFVAKPEEATRAFVAEVHRLTRRLDDDPYTDLLWGILTGYEAADALRIARHKEPLVITRGSAGTGLDLNAFDAACWFSEGQRGVMWEKKPGGKPEKKKVPPDTTRALVDTFNVFKTQLFVTSGHATPNDWQIGYSYKNGQFRCRKGQLFGLDLKRQVHPINSPNPKVYLPAGNCLMGLIPRRDCMALAFMRSGGVCQMFGYTVLTWFGYGGWGVKDLFIGQPGRYSFAEAFYANNQALVHKLVTRYPKVANVDLESYNLERNRRLLGQLAAKHGLIDRTKRQLQRDPLGLLWDRDTVAFYGDPAWDARLKPRPLPWDTRLTEADGLYTFELTAHRDSGRPRPPLHFLPHRVKDVKVVEGAELEPLITDNFLLLPKPTKFEQGKTYRVVFKAKRIRMPDAAASPAAALKAVALLPASYRAAAADALGKAGRNRSQLIAAIRAVEPGQREAIAFLLAHMPERDLLSLNKDYLVANVAYACRARAELPWGGTLPDELFLNYVLPYASINERRDNWRKDFYGRFLPVARQCKTPSEVVLALNKHVFKTLGVAYHAKKRPKPDQGPYESMEAGYASCTGLSVLLIDACRAVGVPARFVGTPLWHNRKGNHSWVEVFDGQWHFVGAAEPGPLDKTWFAANAQKADPARPEHRIYAASFARTPVRFPLVWDTSIRYVRAIDVTRSYTTRRSVTLRILDKPGGEPVAAAITLRLGGHVVAHAAAGRPATFALAGGQAYQAEIVPADGSRPITRQLTLSTEDGQTIDIPLS